MAFGYTDFDTYDDGSLNITVNGKTFIRTGAGELRRFSLVMKGDGFVLDPSTARVLDNGRTAYRMVATRERLGGMVPKGLVGGWVVTAENVSGDAWVDHTSEVHHPSARVCERALISDSSTISGAAMVSGDAVVRRSVLANGYVRAGDRAVLLGSRLSGSSKVIEDAHVDDVTMSGTATVKGSAVVARSSLSGSVRVVSSAVVTDCSASGSATVKGKAIVTGGSLSGAVTVSGNASMMSTNASGSCTVKGNAVVRNSSLTGMVTVSSTAVLDSRTEYGMKNFQ